MSLPREPQVSATLFGAARSAPLARAAVRPRVRPGRRAAGFVGGDERTAWPHGQVRAATRPGAGERPRAQRPWSLGSHESAPA